jgi:hypothetical protein
MKSSETIIFPLLMIMVLAGCGGGGGSGSPGPSVAGPPVAGSNVLTITVNGSLCSGNPTYANEPCVSVTICAPGTNNCQTIDDILLDTGSYGLRIFNQAFTVPLTQVTSGSGLLAECVQFGDGSSVWGPVQMAGVILGNEPAVQIPVQVVNQGFGTPPSQCTGPNSRPDTSPSEANYNGILGVGLFAQDTGLYFSCSGAASGSPCAATTANANVSNPVAALPVDNNGVIVQLPALPAVGAGSASGSLILGIGTQTNNMPSVVTPAGVTAFGADQSAEFTTTFNGIQYPHSFIDTGSNGFFFPAPASLLPACAPWYCPPAATPLSATNAGAAGSPSGIVNFLIGNADGLFSTSNQVFGDLGGLGVNSFDWGLPFFFGRSVFIGINGKISSLGTGPYWAY